MKNKTVAAAALILSQVVLSDPVSASPPVILAIDADMSVSAPAAGEAIMLGAQLAIEQINGAGGLLGREIRLEVHDHRGNPARGRDTIDMLGQREDVLAVIGGIHTPVALHELELIHRHGLIYLGAWAAGTGIVANGYEPNFVFRVSVRDEHAGAFLVEQAAASGTRRLGMLLERTGWGRSNERAITAGARAAGVEICATTWVNWGEQSVETQVASLVDAKCDTVILVANVSEGAVAIREIAALADDRRPAVISHWGISSGDFFDRVGQEVLAEVDLRILQTFSFSSDLPSVRSSELLSDYRRMFGDDIQPRSIEAPAGIAHAFDLVHLLARGVERAGSLDRGSVRRAMEQIDTHVGVMKTYAPPFTADRHDALDASSFILARYAADGALEPVD